MSELVENTENNLANDLVQEYWLDVTNFSRAVMEDVARESSKQYAVSSNNAKNISASIKNAVDGGFKSFLQEHTVKAYDYASKQAKFYAEKIEKLDISAKIRTGYVEHLKTQERIMSGIAREVKSGGLEKLNAGIEKISELDKNIKDFDIKNAKWGGIYQTIKIIRDFK